VTQRPNAGFPNDSTLPLLAAFVLALGFLGLVVAIVSGGGPSGASAAATTETKTTPRTRTPAPLPERIEAPPVTLGVSSAGDGRGRIRIRGELRDCTEECKLTYDQGATATLVAQPSEGSTFVGWTGSCGSPKTCRVKMNGGRSLTALFSSNTARAPAGGPDDECSDDFDNDGDGDVDDIDIDCLDGDTEEPQDEPLPDVPPPAVTPQPVPVVPPPPPPPPPPPAVVEPPDELDP
jgi:hypothetical protein